MSVRVESEGFVRIITIDRPEARNAINRETRAGLEEAFTGFASDDGARVAVLTGAGVAVVPRDWAPEILKRLRAGEEKLAAYTANVKRGVFSNAWVDDQLEAAGCIFDD